MPTTAHLVALEQSLLTAGVRSSATKLDALIHPGFQEIGASGRHFDKADVLSRLPTEANPTVYIADHFNVRLLAPTLAQVIFSTHAIVPPSTTPSKPALRSSLWTYEDGRWQIIFHQGTPLPAAG